MCNKGFKSEKEKGKRYRQAQKNNNTSPFRECSLCLLSVAALIRGKNESQHKGIALKERTHNKPASIMSPSSISSCTGTQEREE